MPRPQLVVGLLDFLRAAIDLRFHDSGARAKFLRDRMLLFFDLFQAHELGHVLHLVDDPGDGPVGREHRRVDGTPVPCLESAAVDLRSPDVVLLHRHRIGLA